MRAAESQRLTTFAAVLSSAQIVWATGRCKGVDSSYMTIWRYFVMLCEGAGLAVWLVTNPVTNLAKT